MDSEHVFGISAEINLSEDIDYRLPVFSIMPDFSLPLQLFILPQIFMLNKNSKHL
jgi:hypothetical protein